MNELIWQAFEFEKHEKTGRWFAILWLAAALFAVIGIILESLLLVVFVLLAALVVSIYGAKDPRTLNIELSEDELSISGEVFPLENFSSFWIFEGSGGENTLSLHFESFVRPALKLFIPKEYTAQARMLLRPHVREKEHDESLIDILAERLKF
jgi:hypothetical protein